MGRPGRVSLVANSSKETLASYDGTARQYAELHWAVRLVRQMEEFEAALPGRRVCDVGCGPGRDVEWLIERGYDVIGVDLSTGMSAWRVDAYGGRRRFYFWQPEDIATAVGAAGLRVIDQYVEHVVVAPGHERRCRVRDRPLTGCESRSDQPAACEMVAWC